MKKGRRERIEKGSREGIEAKRQFEEKEGLRDPPLLEFLDPTLRCSHCFFKSSGWSSSIKNCTSLYNALLKNVMVRNRMQKKCAIGETVCNEIKVFILGRQRIDQKRKKGWACKDVLMQKLARCNYVAYLWKHAHLRDHGQTCKPQIMAAKKTTEFFYHSGLLTVICQLYFLKPRIQQMCQMGKMMMVIMMKITII